MNHKTVRVQVLTVDGGGMDYLEGNYILAKYDKAVHAGLTGRALVNEVISDDWAAPPRKVTISFLSNGKPQEIVIHC